MTNDFTKAMPAHILQNIKEIDLNISSENCLKEINDLLQKTVLVGGKRLRPLLTHLVADLFGVSADAVMPYSRAVELVHAASLSHDDVIDNATMRRGAPSINIVATNKKAVLAGDTLLSTVIVDLCLAGNLALVKEMSLVIRDLSEGEWIQADLIESRNYTPEVIREIALKKTSSVMSYCCLAPAVLADFSPEMVSVTKSFGESLGLAFQMIDDTLDYNEDSMKDQLLDLQNGIVNTVIFHHLNSHPELMLKFKNGSDLSSLISVDVLRPSIDFVKNEAHRELEKAHHDLTTIFNYLNSTKKKNLGPEALLPLQTVISFIALRSV